MGPDVIDPEMSMREARQHVQPHLSHYVMVGITRCILTENREAFVVAQIAFSISGGCVLLFDLKEDHQTRALANNSIKNERARHASFGTMVYAMVYSTCIYPLQRNSLSVVTLQVTRGSLNCQTAPFRLLIIAQIPFSALLGIKLMQF